VLILGGFLLLSCNNDNRGTSKILRIQNANGELTEIEYKIENKDTVFNGIGKYYSALGKITDKVEFKNGLKNGWHEHFDSIGKLESKVFYVNGLAEGAAYFYDSKGKVITEIFYINDKQVFSKKVHENTYLPEVYNMFNESGDVQYVVLFDSTGNKFYENGYIFDRSIKLKGFNSDFLRQNKEINLKVFTTQLPEYSKKIDLYYYDNNNKRREISYQLKDSGYYVTIKFVPEILGSAAIVLVGKLNDANGKSVKYDTLLTKVNIVK